MRTPGDCQYIPDAGLVQRSALETRSAPRARCKRPPGPADGNRCALVRQATPPTGVFARVRAREGAKETASLGGNCLNPWARKATAGTPFGWPFRGSAAPLRIFTPPCRFALPGGRSHQRSGVTNRGRTGTERQQRPVLGQWPGSCCRPQRRGESYRVPVARRASAQAARAEKDRPPSHRAEWRKHGVRRPDGPAWRQTSAGRS